MSEEISKLKAEEAGTFNTHHIDDDNNWNWDNNSKMGLIFVLVGVGLLVANMTGLSFTNWWALFFFIPAVISFGKGFQKYTRAGYLTHSAAGAMGGSLFMIFLGSMFLFGLSWSTFWPAIFIVIGASSLLKAMAR